MEGEAARSSAGPGERLVDWLPPVHPPLQPNHSHFYACPFPEPPRGCSTLNLYFFYKGRPEKLSLTHTRRRSQAEMAKLGEINGVFRVRFEWRAEEDPLPSPRRRHSVVNRLAPPGLLISRYGVGYSTFV